MSGMRWHETDTGMRNADDDDCGVKPALDDSSFVGGEIDIVAVFGTAGSETRACYCARYRYERSELRKCELKVAGCLPYRSLMWKKGVSIAEAGSGGFRSSE